ncbi:hypothetical protein HTY54_27485 [Escherichia coli]|uniref:hypothetical protein n=1 Tax=Escherichia coli TaxID=562 RepID=UPI0016028766|nr:hypothetical protein [Escherichia coli]MBW6087300.1 hypothetical protein [Escherichia coli]MBW6101581.1 hypothetical protein [Escherichia coli]QNB92878.1 hypothetical protein H5C79_26235 [Escherichia coli]
MRGAAPAALPARLSGQKVVYGCMQGTGVIFRDTVTVSGCLLLRPLRLPAALAASGRQARLRQAAAGAPASLRRTRWRGFGLPLRSDA